MAQALGIVHVLVSGEPPEHGLPQQTDQHMTTVLPGADCVVGCEVFGRWGKRPDYVVIKALDVETTFGVKSLE